MNITLNRCSINNFKDMEITDFELYTNVYKNEDILTILWNDKYTSKSYLNANDLKLN